MLEKVPSCLCKKIVADLKKRKEKKANRKSIREGARSVYWGSRTKKVRLSEKVSERERKSKIK